MERKGKIWEFLENSYQLSVDLGSQDDVSDMRGLIAQVVNLQHHLEDQAAGIENPALNPHHERTLLKKGIFSGNLQIARLVKQIKKRQA
jgi:hypothetical protein